MIRSLPSLRSSRASLVSALVAGVLCAGWLLAPESRSQAPAATTNVAALNALIAKLKTQQDQIAANQTKIEAQTALLKEELRQAKLYSARGGSGHR